MSKGNLFLGKARGKVGSVVFSTLKGQQVARAYNANPNNPRSINQMAQRVLLGAPVLFYRHATANRLKFAFENKSQNQSDYNAFVAANIDTEKIALTKEMVRDNFPAVGAWRLTKGSLLSPSFTITAMQATTGENILPNRVVFVAPLVDNGNMYAWLEDNFGDQVPEYLVSEILRNNFNYADGDMLTFLNVSVPSYVESGDVSWNGEAPYYQTKQYIVNSSEVGGVFQGVTEFNDAQLATASDGLYIAQGRINGALGIYLVCVMELPTFGGMFTLPQLAIGSAFIASSKQSGAIKVSTSKLTLSGSATEIVNLLTSDAMRNRAIQSYSASTSNVASNYMLDPSKGVEGGIV